MAFDATVFPILIAGPSDVTDEMDAAELAVSNWNDGHATAMGLMMEARTWRSHAAPELGEDAQAILNRQMGDHCDAIIAMFGARMGTPTPRALSGTAEEIDRFVTVGKRVMVYFRLARSREKVFRRSNTRRLRISRKPCANKAY